MENLKVKTFESQKKRQFFIRKFRRRKYPLSLTRIRYEQKVAQIKRVVKVVKGGKILSFRAIVILGNAKGKVAVGIGKAQEVGLAIEKAIMYGKKRFVNVALTVNSSIPHVVYSKYCASMVMLRPASEGTGIIAGGVVKAVLELAGIQNILAKQYGSNNLLNNAKATIQALRWLNQKIEVRCFLSSQKKQYYNRIMELNLKKRKLQRRTFFRKIRKKAILMRIARYKRRKQKQKR